MICSSLWYDEAVRRKSGHIYCHPLANLRQIPLRFQREF